MSKNESSSFEEFRTKWLKEKKGSPNQSSGVKGSFTSHRFSKQKFPSEDERKEIERPKGFVSHRLSGKEREKNKNVEKVRGLKTHKIT